MNRLSDINDLFRGGASWGRSCFPPAAGQVSGWFRRPPAGSFGWFRRPPDGDVADSAGRRLRQVVWGITGWFRRPPRWLAGWLIPPVVGVGWLIPPAAALAGWVGGWLAGCLTDSAGCWLMAVVWGMAGWFRHPPRWLAGWLADSAGCRGWCERGHVSGMGGWFRRPPALLAGWLMPPVGGVGLADSARVQGSIFFACALGQDFTSY